MQALSPTDRPDSAHGPAQPQATRAGPAGARRGGRVLRKRWTRWWAPRHPPSDALLLTQRNVYIVPTAAGWLFALVLAVLLLASINYQLNLGYLLTFTLAGATLSSLHATHGVLRDLSGSLHLAAPLPANLAAPLHIWLRDAVAPDAQAAGWWRRRGSVGRVRHSLAVHCVEASADAWVWTRVPAGGEVQLTLSVLPPGRGWHALPTLCLETRFPFGLFRAWSYWRPASRLLAWPVAESDAPPLQPASALQDGHPRTGGAPVPGLEQAGVRPWRRGDAPQQILWKKSAQSIAGGGDPISREAAPTAPPDLHIEWDAAASLSDTEARIARLTAWVREADASGARYALHLPGGTARERELDSGAAHLGRCLTQLACWGRVQSPAHTHG